MTCRWDPDHLRTRFVQALSDMYRAEVPLYGHLVEIVRSVDDSVLASRRQRPDGDAIPVEQGLPSRHRLERHGAIRLGTQHEMRTIGRLFAILGMHPVGYYDLSQAPGGGFPLHGTAFRPTSEDLLRKNPFRVFTTVLRPDLIKSETVRSTAQRILRERELFSPELYKLLDKFESFLSAAPNTKGHAPAALTVQDADSLITESLKIFKWHSRSSPNVTFDTYGQLKAEHPVVADIVCFPSAHINHLTPRTLDIDAVQSEMVRRGLPAKERIEGPPPGRSCEILLRQTSFKALEEPVTFASSSPGTRDSQVDGTHTARFGEVEQRGAAVTLKGRRLYDFLLEEAALGAERVGREMNGGILTALFRERYPDDWTTLRREGLVFFRYRVPSQFSGTGPCAGLKIDDGATIKMETLLEQGVVECEPITYEDFLPFSAAGIFKSNLGGNGLENMTAGPAVSHGYDDARKELEVLLGQKIPSEIDLYETLQGASVRECERHLGLREGQIVL
ncbi:hypothetical protein QBC37DRAFT_327418 [Rhypophila decipiens]|uniref:2-oxoadipate dioxygenase/decarboxylase n=1 Tax=Rhypophila decipiens TaxID=261697 RepID=A0AAN6Y173_9PEZI|nr:hypothetical protein QBC37DRAFT_327418 [Rhypophila decipiens]